MISKADTYVEAVSLVTSGASPEEVFGVPAESPRVGEAAALPTAIQDEYHRLARLLHPDMNGGQDEGFKRLREWFDKARGKIAAGAYGHPVLATIRSKRNAYEILGQIAAGALCDVYRALNAKYESVVVKVARRAASDDLIANEAHILTYLRYESESRDLQVMLHIPELLDSFQVVQGGAKKQVNVIRALPGYYTLAEVLCAHPDGVDLRDAAWMWNRLLGALGAAQTAGIVHGGVVPDNFMICPENHDGVLIDWAYSARRGESIKAICPSWKEFYPPEVFAKQPASTATDLYMAAKCFLYLTGRSEGRLPRALLGLIRACLLSQRRRCGDAWELHKEFAEVLQAVFGPRKFRVFRMPEKG